MDSQLTVPIDQNSIDSKSPYSFSAMERNDLYRNWKTLPRDNNNQREFIEKGTLPDVELSDFPRRYRNREDNYDRESSRMIYADSRKLRETSAITADCPDENQIGREESSNSQNAFDGKSLRCEARMLADEAKKDRLAREIQEEQERERMREAKFDKLIAEIPETVKAAASRGEHMVAILDLGRQSTYGRDRYGWMTELPQIDSMSQKVIDRLAELDLQPAYQKTRLDTWQLVASW